MRIGIIGYGNLGKAFVQGLVTTGFSQKDIAVNARSQKTRECVAAEFKDIFVTADKMKLVQWSDVIVLVVEPINAADVLLEIKEYDLSEKTIISFMAGITIADIRNKLGDKHKAVKVVRVMPNIAICNGNGVLGVTYDGVENKSIQDLSQIFHKLGYVLEAEEASLNHITVTAASGLAFAASLMNSYEEASNLLFNDLEVSREITLRVFENLIDMVKSEGCSFQDIVQRITTKGGTTEAGMQNLKQDLITETLGECIMKSYEKTKRIL